MIDVGAIVQSVKSIIKQSISDTEVSVKLAYEKNKLANPIRKTYVILDLDKLTVSPYRDGGSNTRKSEYKLSVNIHRNESSDPKRLINFFSEIVNIFDASPAFTLEEAGCTQIRSDADSNSIYLPGYIKFTIYN